ncbi:hypothetical protein CJ030_MR3G014448 [Morella rubra]|uniref:FLZ-type domain-containing protein n=1 Tax=Morella rubra TaxID=262757 RepID=A0A6A1VYW7_9ROSI|nr:hypothetical protein CJ030_MR3G014448 [Morella rubra]
MVFTLMSPKRCRMFRSSSQGEIGLLGQVRPLDPPDHVWERRRPDAGRKPVRNPLATNSSSPPAAKQEQQPRKSILTLGSPTIWEPNDEGSKNKPNERFGEFFQTCSLCKKKLQEDGDLYMYGYLGAFCSAECRDDRIALDGFYKQISLESMKLRTGKKDRRRQLAFKAS